MAKKIYNNSELAQFLAVNRLKNKDLANFLGISDGAVTFFLDGALPPEQYLKLKRSDFDSSMLTENCMQKDHFQNQTNNNSVVLNAQNNGNVNYNNIPGIDSKTNELKPVLPTKLYKELNTDASNYIASNNVNYQPNVNQFSNFDVFYEVIDDTMLPDFKPSDILAMQKITKPYVIINGEYYCINSIHGIFVRMTYNDGESVVLKSNNDRFSDITINKSDVFNMYRVVGLIRKNL